MVEQIGTNFALCFHTSQYCSYHFIPKKSGRTYFSYCNFVHFSMYELDIFLLKFVRYNSYRNFLVILYIYTTVYLYNLVVYVQRGLCDNFLPLTFTIKLKES